MKKYQVVKCPAAIGWRLDLAFSAGGDAPSSETSLTTAGPLGKSTENEDVLRVLSDLLVFFVLQFCFSVLVRSVLSADSPHHQHTQRRPKVAA